MLNTGFLNVYNILLKLVQIGILKCCREINSVDVVD